LGTKTRMAAACCFLVTTVWVEAVFFFLGVTVTEHVVAAFTRTAPVVTGGDTLAAWHLVGLGLRAKTPGNRDMFSYGFVVSDSLAIVHVATGGSFVSITRVAAGLRAVSLPRKENTSLFFVVWDSGGGCEQGQFGGRGGLAHGLDNWLENGFDLVRGGELGLWLATKEETEDHQRVQICRSCVF
jgi:hypothetical protein